MADVLRWGRSAYETDADLAGEARAAAACGLTWALAADRSRPPPLDGVRALVVNSRVRVTSEVLEGFRGDLVLTTTSGVEHIDLHAAWARELQVARCPMARRDAVVGQTAAWLIALLRRLGELEAASAAGTWARGGLPALMPRDVVGARVAVVGWGVIGARVGEVLGGLGADVRIVDPFASVPGRRWALEEALSDVDAVTLHSQLTRSGSALLSADRLRLLPPDAVVVNTARGGALDVDAAVAAVASGRLGGLASDVFPVEPWPRLSALAGDPRVRFSPHSAGYTRGLGNRVAHEVGQALRALVSRQPIPHAVLPDDPAWQGHGL